MVKSISIIYMFITLIFAVGFPVGLAIYLYIKERISMKAVLIGALMFFLFQVILRIPALVYVQNQAWYQIFAIRNMMLTVIIIAFTAALFETIGRYVGLKYLLKNKLERKNGIAYGIGHGGIEAILLVGITYVINIVYSILINTGVISSTLVPQLINTSPSLFLAAGIERVFAILFHIAAALLVTYGIMENKKIYIFYSFMLHFLLDGVLVILQVSGVSVWGVELWVVFIGLMSLLFIIQSKRMFSFPNIGRDNGDNQDEDH